MVLEMKKKKSAVEEGEGEPSVKRAPTDQPMLDYLARPATTRTTLSTSRADPNPLPSAQEVKLQLGSGSTKLSMKIKSLLLCLKVESIATDQIAKEKVRQLNAGLIEAQRENVTLKAELASVDAKLKSSEGLLAHLQKDLDDAKASHSAEIGKRNWQAVWILAQADAPRTSHHEDLGGLKIVCGLL
ncbi:hypothetical protein GH714_022864 [Hevea brasiliensis]|uniref:Uncharacterized protein n=1 Tax=Hevea brasiliensis TaxID=3981 RepID=A0A6A6LJZ7_HEVBR|nr:hypothetical protein GH714_022864 [Hevea brasiliensis]